MKESKSNQTPQAVSIGSHLRAKREEKGLTLAEISAETMVIPATLQMMEEENWERLPPAAFVKGFVKAYAQAVGADPEEALAIYMASSQIAGPRETKGFGALTSSAWIMQLTVLAAFTILVATLVVMVCLPGNGNEWNPGAASPMPLLEPAQKREKPIPGPLHLRIDASGETWVRVMADGVEIRRLDLKRNQNMDLFAKREFNILVGTPSAIRLSLDGRPVQIAARGGQAVNVKLP